MLGSTARAYYRKVPFIDCTMFVSTELRFGAEVFLSS